MVQKRVIAEFYLKKSCRKAALFFEICMNGRSLPLRRNVRALKLLTIFFETSTLKTGWNRAKTSEVKMTTDACYSR
jgi:hypothetical protein